MNYKFVETTRFTQRISKLKLENELRKLQEELLRNPTKGDTDPGTGGLRKVRMGDEARGQGKSFGARVHYVVVPQRRVIYLLFVYGKDERDSLTAQQKKQLRDVVRGLFEER